MSEAIQNLNEHISQICDRLDADIKDVAGVPMNFTLFAWDKEQWTYLSTSPDKNIIDALRMMMSAWDKSEAEVPELKYL
jgi:hypothetical protein